MQRRIGFALLLATLAGAAGAADDHWLLRVGVHNVNPKSDNGTVAGAKLTVDSSVRPTVNVDYFFTPNVALDVLAALPFKHDIALNGSTVGSVKDLPPTVSLQYHFMPQARLHPFIAAGLNYTRFFSEKLNGGGNLSLDSSFGFAAQLGLDASLAKGWLLGADLRYMNLDSKVHVNGADAGTAHIDPLVYGITVGRRF